MAIVLAGIALIGSALALKGIAPALQKSPTEAPPANIVASARNPGGETAGSPAELSGTAPVAPEVAAQAVEGPASEAPAQTTDPDPDPRPPVRPVGTPLAPQASSAAERGSPAAAPEPPVKPAPEHRNGAVRPPFDLPARRPGKLTARVAASKGETAIPGAADAPTPPLPIATPAKPQTEADGFKALPPIAESGVAPATPAQPSANPLLRALGNLFGGGALPARQSVDPAAIGSTGWAVQLGGPRSEADAKRDLKRINARYGSALKGSTLGLHKVFVNGETVYRLHVVGLSRDEAAALCSRVKGDGGNCAIVR